MPDYVRPMRPEDIEPVTRIDREAFPTEWPAPNFKRELENRLAHYVVACRADRLAADVAGSVARTSGWLRIRARLAELAGRSRGPAGRTALGDECIIGFAGMWVMADEAHITSIATTEAHRRQGIGELLLQSVIDLSRSLKARIVTLEVRVSNTTAQALYAKYGFKQVGLRRAYYTDNREDAIIMSTDHLDSARYRAQVDKLRRDYNDRWGPDRYRLHD